MSLSAARGAIAFSILVACVGCSGAKSKESSTTSVAPVTPRNRILVVVSSESRLRLREGTSHPTGYFLNELVVPVRRLVSCGYEVVIANPQGNPAAMDANSDSEKFFANDPAAYDVHRRFHNGLTGIKRPEKLSAVIEKGLDVYSAVFFPGGHAPMIDLCQDPDVARVLQHFHETGKPTAMICHGPIALLSTLKDSAALIQALEADDTARATLLAHGWPYAGYQMTAFSTAEEEIVEKTTLNGSVLFDPQEALTLAGGNVVVAEPEKSHVIVDRELITGQNPASDGALAEALLKALESRPLALRQ